MQGNSSRPNPRRHEPKVELTERFSKTQSSFNVNRSGPIKVVPSKPHEHLEKNLNGRGDMVSLIT